MNRQSMLRAGLPVLVIALAWLVGQAMLALKPEPVRNQSTRPAAMVETVAVQKGNVAVTVVSQGTVSPAHRTRLSSEVSGRIVSVSPAFGLGKRVNSGDTLLQIDPISYQAAVADAEAALIQARLDLADRQARYAKDTLSVQQAEALLNASEARLKQAQRDLANTTLRAPFDAVIESRYADIGQYLTVGSDIAGLASAGRAEIRLPVSAADFALVAPAYFEAFPATTAILSATLGNQTVQWPATIERAEAMLDSQTRVFTLVATVEEPYAAQPPLPIGLFVHARIQAQALADAVRLPRSVLHDDHVFIVDNNTLQQRAVSILHRDEHSVVIGEGLNDGERVMTTRLPMAFDGMPVSADNTP